MKPFPAKNRSIRESARFPLTLPLREREQPSKVSGNSQTLGFGDRRMTFLPLPAGEGRDEGKWPIGSFQRTYWKTVAGDCKFLSLSICFLLFINPALDRKSVV